MQSAAHGREPVRPAEGETCTPMAAVGCMEGFLPARAPKPVGIPHGGTWSAHGRFWRVLSTPIRGRGATARPIAAARWRGWNGCSIAVSGKSRQEAHDARAIWPGNSGGSGMFLTQVPTRARCVRLGLLYARASFFHRFHARGFRTSLRARCVPVGSSGDPARWVMRTACARCIRPGAGD